ncbi:RusA family crossover junction endodeoxyribonuclease [Arthrobacter sp. GMC3]|uniref:RusA family crossover junction endodeoxyribonuclease n=1 Tax=Arthrobacter sp. GMC3 TaxID=2058894 RepID=UPI000CE382DD|nr:RusA family crossover junction endodeoxyribonuclease [Arthrobacter sp. GMC3]
MTPQEPRQLTTSATGGAERVGGGREVNGALKSPPVDFTFHVEGKAAPQGSKKGFISGGKVNMVEMSKNLPAWRAQVATAAMRAWGKEALDCPVSVQATFRIPKPKSTKFSDYPAGPPDTDKLQRAVGDALKTAGVITDDSRIVHWDAAKVWGPAGATITITEMRTRV